MINITIVISTVPRLPLKTAVYHVHNEQVSLHLDTPADEVKSIVTSCIKEETVTQVSEEPKTKRARMDESVTASANTSE